MFPKCQEECHKNTNTDNCSPKPTVVWGREAQGSCMNWLSIGVGEEARAGKNTESPRTAHAHIPPYLPTFSFICSLQTELWGKEPYQESPSTSRLDHRQGTARGLYPGTSSLQFCLNSEESNKVRKRNFVKKARGRSKSQLSTGTKEPV